MLRLIWTREPHLETARSVYFPTCGEKPQSDFIGSFGSNRAGSVGCSTRCVVVTHDGVIEQATSDYFCGRSDLRTESTSSGMKEYTPHGLTRNSHAHSLFVYTAWRTSGRCTDQPTSFLFPIVGTLGLASARYQQTPRDSTKENDYAKQLQARKLQFPRAEYEEADLTDPKRNESLKEQKARKRRC